MILNATIPSELESNTFVNIGIALSNATRKMSLKPFLYLKNQRTLLLLLKKAFLMERKRFLWEAIKHYKQALHLLQGHNSEMLAFTWLHYAWCLSMVGRQKQALELLQKVETHFPGTHYAHTAELLLRLLKKHIEQTKNITQQTKLSPLEKARQLYHLALFAQACQYYSKASNLTIKDLYQMARCSEERGEQKQAVTIYMKLASQTSSKDIKFARLANRRIFLFSSIYAPSKTLQNIAKQNSLTLGDSDVLREITLAANKQQTPIQLSNSPWQPSLPSLEAQAKHLLLVSKQNTSYPKTKPSHIIYSNERSLSGTLKKIPKEILKETSQKNFSYWHLVLPSLYHWQNKQKNKALIFGSITALAFTAWSWEYYQGQQSTQGNPQDSNDFHKRRRNFDNHQNNQRYYAYIFLATYSWYLLDTYFDISKNKIYRFSPSASNKQNMHLSKLSYTPIFIFTNKSNAPTAKIKKQSFQAGLKLKHLF